MIDPDKSATGLVDLGLDLDFVADAGVGGNKSDTKAVRTRIVSGQRVKLALVRRTTNATIGVPALISWVIELVMSSIEANRAYPRFCMNQIAF